MVEGGGTRIVSNTSSSHFCSGEPPPPPPALSCVTAGITEVVGIAATTVAGASSTTCGGLVEAGCCQGGDGRLSGRGVASTAAVDTVIPRPLGVAATDDDAEEALPVFLVPLPLEAFGVEADVVEVAAAADTRMGVGGERCVSGTPPLLRPSTMRDSPPPPLEVDSRALFASREDF